MSTEKTGSTRCRPRVSGQHGGATGVAFAWEAQLLNTPTPATATRAQQRGRPAQRRGRRSAAPTPVAPC